jgi:hypothetical protein
MLSLLYRVPFNVGNFDFENKSLVSSYWKISHYQSVYYTDSYFQLRLFKWFLISLNFFGLRNLAFYHSEELPEVSVYIQLFEKLHKAISPNHSPTLLQPDSMKFCNDEHVTIWRLGWIEIPNGVLNYFVKSDLLSFCSVTPCSATKVQTFWNNVLLQTWWPKSKQRGQKEVTVALRGTNIGAPLPGRYSRLWEPQADFLWSNYWIGTPLGI